MRSDCGNTTATFIIVSLTIITALSVKISELFGRQLNDKTPNFTHAPPVSSDCQF
jgi:hypothetical protein